MSITENSGSHCQYYLAPVTHPTNPGQSVGYVANCEDIIQSLGLTFDEGCEFKSIWRRGRGRQGFVKAESTPLRDAIKAAHYAGRVLALELRKGQPRPAWATHTLIDGSTGNKEFVAIIGLGEYAVYEGESIVAVYNKNSYVSGSVEILP